MVFSQDSHSPGSESNSGTSVNHYFAIFGFKQPETLWTTAWFVLFTWTSYCLDTQPQGSYRNNIFTR